MRWPWSDRPNSPPDHGGEIDARTAFENGVRDGKNSGYRTAFSDNPRFCPPTVRLIHAQLKEDLERIRQERLTALAKVEQEDIQAETDLQNGALRILRANADYLRLTSSAEEVRLALEAPNGQAPNSQASNGQASNGQKGGRKPLSKEEADELRARFAREERHDALERERAEVDRKRAETHDMATQAKNRLDSGPRRWLERHEHYRSEVESARRRAEKLVERYRMGLLREHPRGTQIADEWSPQEPELDLSWLEESPPERFAQDSRLYIDATWQQTQLAVLQNRQPPPISASDSEQDTP